MEENVNVPLFKKADKAIFEQIDRFKLSPNYTVIQDFYNGLDEDEQKVAKALSIMVLVFLPVFFLGIMALQNNALKDDLNLRVEIVTKAQQIIGQSQSFKEVSPVILAPNPIDSQSMMTSRLSSTLSTMGVDLSKIQVNDFESTNISETVLRSDANIAFTNVSTDELMNLFSGMIQREKFRIQNISVTRNADTNLLQGQFHSVHFSTITTQEEQ